MDLYTPETILQKHIDTYKRRYKEKTDAEINGIIEENNKKHQILFEMCSVCYGMQTSIGIKFSGDLDYELTICENCIQKAAFMIESYKQSKQ